jgi:hypothetical protein
MYLSISYVIESIKRLGAIHPFYGITFLTCKANSIPVGKQIEFSMDNSNKIFMDRVHSIYPASKYYYQPYISNSHDKHWVTQKYPSSGLQAINTQTFGPAFLHTKKEKSWGWATDYVNFLSDQLPGKKLLPIIDLAIWIFKDKCWPEETDLNKIILYFLHHFNITDSERRLLFTETIQGYPPLNPFQDKQITWNDLSDFLTLPPDAGPSRGATLSYIKLENIGPALNIEMEPSNRLNIITGDNGLGKSFVMDCVWWSLTGIWPEIPAFPRLDSKHTKKASITYRLASLHGKPITKVVTYDSKQRLWPRDKNSPTIPCLIIYSRVDGSYAVWDPNKQYNSNIYRKQFVFPRSEIWNGIDGSIEGLIRDWVKWQSSPEKYPFDILTKVLIRMSPPDLGELIPGQPIRMINEIRDIPTIIHPYGEIPISNVSAGVKQIITLAYLIVWAWYEHKVEANLHNIKPENRMVILIDEIEAHLHPKWQRVILPALLDVQSLLSRELEIQFIISTHSPLVLASAESSFNQSIDSLFHLDVNKKTGNAQLKYMDFIKFGQINSWLTSPIFNLAQARSQEAEGVISHAKRLQLQNAPDTNEIAKVHKQLTLELSETDPFWPRWIYFAEKYGVKI